MVIGLMFPGVVDDKADIQTGGKLPLQDDKKNMYEVVFLAEVKRRDIQADIYISLGPGHRLTDRRAISYRVYFVVFYHPGGLELLSIFPPGCVPASAIPFSRHLKIKI